MLKSSWVFRLVRGEAFLNVRVQQGCEASLCCFTAGWTALMDSPMAWCKGIHHCGKTNVPHCLPSVEMTKSAYLVMWEYLVLDTLGQVCRGFFICNIVSCYGSGSLQGVVVVLIWINGWGFSCSGKGLLQGHWKECLMSGKQSWKCIAKLWLKSNVLL